MTTLRPWGRSDFTASANKLTPRRIACRDSSPCTICLPYLKSPIAVMAGLAAKLETSY